MNIELVLVSKGSYRSVHKVSRHDISSALPFLRFGTNMKISVFVYFALLVVATTGQILDNRETCSHRVISCDPNVDHFETKVSMKHSSSVKRLDYENTYILLEQAWPTRGPWMKQTAQVGE